MTEEHKDRTSIRDRAVVIPDMRVCADVDDLSRRAAEAVVDRITDAVRTRGTCSIVLSGGNTPRTLYRLMASQRPSPIPWPYVHVFWGEERDVPPEDARSNFGMAKETLLDYVPCPAANVHRMPTQDDFATSADVTSKRCATPVGDRPRRKAFASRQGATERS
jgi:6-phosphogluconolactonase